MDRKKHIDMHKHIFSIFAATVAFEVLELLKRSDLPESALLKVNRRDRWTSATSRFKKSNNGLLK